MFNLVGADIMAWFNEMPKVHKVQEFTASQLKETRAKTIDQFYAAKACACCRAQTQDGEFYESVHWVVQNLTYVR